MRFQHSAEATIVTRGQLELGLCFPLYDPSRPFLYEALSKIRPSHDLAQWNGNTFRIISEWERLSRGEYTPTAWSTYDSSQAGNYTPLSFAANYRSGTATNGDLAGFSASPNHHKTLPKGFKKLLLDEDPKGKTYNKHARHTSDAAWDRVPLAIYGPLLHDEFSPPTESYPLWVVNVDRPKSHGAQSNALNLRKRDRGSRARAVEETGKKLKADKVGGASSKDVEDP